jgi:hypothetical protein
VTLVRGVTSRPFRLTSACILVADFSVCVDMLEPFRMAGQPSCADVRGSTRTLPRRLILLSTKIISHGTSHFCRDS